MFLCILCMLECILIFIHQITHLSTHSSLRIPNLRVVAGEHGESEMEVPDDPADCATLSLPQAPILLSLNKVGERGWFLVSWGVVFLEGCG